jgi:hypothetical protein
LPSRVRRECKRVSISTHGADLSDRLFVAALRRIESNTQFLMPLDNELRSPGTCDTATVLPVSAVPQPHQSALLPEQIAAVEQQRGRQSVRTSSLGKCLLQKLILFGISYLKMPLIVISQYILDQCLPWECYRTLKELFPICPRRPVGVPIRQFTSVVKRH